MYYCVNQHYKKLKQIVNYQLAFTALTLTHCSLGVCKSIQTTNTEWWGAGIVTCRERAENDLHMVPLMPATQPSFASLKSRKVLYLSGPTLFLLSWKKAVKRVLFCCYQHETCKPNQQI